jgi:hypothetical protein
LPSTSEHQFPRCQTYAKVIKYQPLIGLSGKFREKKEKEGEIQGYQNRPNQRGWKFLREAK